MKLKIIIALFFSLFLSGSIFAQQSTSGEIYGRTLNFGMGIGYYRHVGYAMPVVHVNYEFDVLKNFTLAPFVSFYSYTSGYYYGKPNNGTRYYYHETVIPVGVKGTYYFDDLFNAGSKWDFYAAGSIGFAFSRSYWDDGYSGDRNVFNGANPLFMDIHLGAEYHFNNRFGAFLDLSSGVSTIGLAIH